MISGRKELAKGLSLIVDDNDEDKNSILSCTKETIDRIDEYFLFHTEDEITSLEEIIRIKN